METWKKQWSSNYEDYFSCTFLVIKAAKWSTNNEIKYVLMEVWTVVNEEQESIKTPLIRKHVS